MNKPQWTPGPWSAQWDDAGLWFIEPLGVTGPGLRGDSGECLERANARLIAASPRLYAALSHVIGVLEAIGHADLVCAIEARAALREARGEDAPAIQSPTPQQEPKKGTQGGQ